MQIVGPGDRNSGGNRQHRADQVRGYQIAIASQKQVGLSLSRVHTDKVTDGEVAVMSKT